MLKKLREHLTGNRGDANVSKMTLIAIIFVVGAILLVMITSAFRGPINRWLDKVTDGWFADSNGMFEADNQWLLEEKNDNGTYKNAAYVWVLGPDAWILLDMPQGLRNGTEHDGWQGEHGASSITHLMPGSYAYGSYFQDAEVLIATDGSYIEVDGQRFQAYLPGDPNLPTSIQDFIR